MGNIVTGIRKSTLLPGGERMVSGSLTMSSSYPAGTGDTMDLSNVLKAGGSPTVTIGGAAGVVLVHNQGAANVGVVKAYYATQNAINGAVENTTLVEVTNAVDLSAINATFIAVGPAY